MTVAIPSLFKRAVNILCSTYLKEPNAIWPSQGYAVKTGRRAMSLRPGFEKDLTKSSWL